MPEASDQVTEETVGHEEVPLTPAQVGILKKFHIDTIGAPLWIIVQHLGFLQSTV